MSWSIVEVARSAGVSSRTLRHYDDIGLVPPAYVGGNGYRYYEREQLHRLQEVMVLRELGLPLDAVARVLDGTHDRAAVLREHRDALLAEQERLGRLAATVTRTIAEIERIDDDGNVQEGMAAMTPEELFDGFDAEKQKEYEADLVERYGPQAQDKIDESWRRVGTMTKADADRIQAELAERDGQYAALLDAGADPADPRVQEVTAGHYRWVSQFWTPDAEAFAGLGDLYVDHDGFRARYDAVRPGMAEFVRDAMAVYAVERLT